MFKKPEVFGEKNATQQPDRQFIPHARSKKRTQPSQRQHVRAGAAAEFFLFCNKLSRKTAHMPASGNLLELKQISKQYPARGGTENVPVLIDISLTLAAGDTLAIIGPSGSGKSTLLQIIGTLDRATSGEVWLAGQNLATRTELQLATVRNRQIGFVFQAHFLLPQCTVLENVLVPTLAGSKSEIRNLKSESESTAARAERLLKRVGLGDRMHHRPGQLSGGERQRAAVVRALINRPQLLLADEPTGALDQNSATTLGQLLVDLNREEGVTLMVVTHALDLAKRMKRVLTLTDGRLVEAPSAKHQAPEKLQ